MNSMEFDAGAGSSCECQIWLSRRCLDLVVLLHSSLSELNLNVRHR
jgi:hypothetical protein